MPRCAPVLRTSLHRLVLLLLLGALFAPGAVRAQLDPGQEAEYEIAARTILCDCGCHPQSVHDCACGRAEQMRRDVAGLAAQGLTGQQVIARYVERDGEKIRIAPTARGFNLVAWLGPLAALLLASLAVMFVIRRWSRRQPSPADAPASPVPPADDPYRARLRQELGEWR